MYQSLNTDCDGPCLLYKTLHLSTRLRYSVRIWPGCGHVTALAAACRLLSARDELLVCNVADPHLVMPAGSGQGATEALV